MKCLGFAVLTGLAWIGAASGAYTFDYTYDGSSAWHKNGSGCTSSTFYNATISFGNPNDYMVSLAGASSGSGTTAIVYLRADSTTISGGVGSYVSVERNAGTGTVTVKQAISGSVTQLGSVSGNPVGVGDPVGISATIWGTTLWVYGGSGLLGTWTVTASSGQPGFGQSSWCSVDSFAFGHHDTTGPTIGSGTMLRSVYASSVDLRWPTATDDTNGIGFFRYEVYRNGALLGYSYVPAWSDRTASTGTSYTYSVDAMDWHDSVGAPISLTLTTPSPAAVDPRRPGVRSDGAYWGGGGEQIDMLSGNLNFTLPLLTAQGRAGWKVPVGISYNSQNWRQDGGVNWQLADDTGYGFGWRLAIGSITPYYVTWSSGVDHYVYTDVSGAEYNLRVNSSGVWTSQEAAAYVWFDSSTNILYFRDGTHWVMGCASGGAEFDAGALYPTIIQDVHGNQVIIAYRAGYGLSATNTSSRINTIADVRFGAGGVTYTFTWNGDAPIPHLTGIANSMGSGETYTLGYASTTLGPPFGADSGFSGAVKQLSTITTVNGPFSATYDTAGASELLQLTLPQGGHLRWAYSTETYAGSKSLRAITTRYLAADSSGATEWTYPITRDSVTSSQLHSTATIADASGVGTKTWNFIASVTSGQEWKLGLLSEFLQKASSGGTTYTDDTFTWAQTPTSGHPYIGTKVSVTDPGTGSSQSATTTQTLDQYGNATQMVIYPYNNTTTPLRTYNSTWLTGSGYVSNYVRNRLVSTTVTTGGTTKTLVTNTYASVCCGPGGTAPGNLYDSSGALPWNQRGILTQAVTPAGTTSMSYYQFGALQYATDANGNTVSLSADSATNYSAPQTVTSPTYSESINYSLWLAVTQTTGLNGEVSASGYDGYGRPTGGTSPYGATTTFAFSASNVTPAWQTRTAPDGYTKTTLDGLGRVIKVERGPDSSTIQAVVDTEYAPCACSPLGTLKRSTMPHAVGGTQVWTTYAYDGIGRTLTVTQPDGSSQTFYSYAGNTTTVTDPAGKWKKFTNDVDGSLVTVTEPDPANPTTATFTTIYTYDWAKHLSGVSMTRGSTTQTRTFVYDDGGKLTSASNPENGTTSYYYNTDNTLWYRHDAKGQDVVYTYDTKKRVTQIQRYPTGKSNAEDTCQRVTYTYDGNLSGSTYSTNYYGRLTATQYSICAPTSDGVGYSPQVTEMYNYHAAGAVTGKRFRMIHAWANVNNYDYSGSTTDTLDTTYTFNSAGLLLATTLSTDTGGGTVTYTNGYDSMSRPSWLSDSSMTDGGTGQAIKRAQSAAYDLAGRMTSFQMYTSASGSAGAWTGAYATQSQTYNVNGQLATLGWSGSGAPAGTLTYGYSSTANNGQITQVTDSVSGETVVYQYDALKRLTSAASTPNSGSTPTAWTETYGYDGFGNLTSKVLNGTTTTIAVTASTNQLTSASYDANGNMTSGAGGTLGYDEANRMKSFAPVSGGHEYYGYAPDNKRIYRLKADGVTEELTLWGARGEKLGVYAVNGAAIPFGTSSTVTLAISKVELYFAGKMIWDGPLVSSGGAAPSGGAVFQDRLGTNRASGARFRPYGDEITSTSQDREKFATYNRDAFSGLDYADQRYYAASYGRFDSPDPFSQSAIPRNSLSWNRYSYVHGDPINSHDPQGLVPEEDESSDVETNGGTSGLIYFDLGSDLTADDMGPGGYLGAIGTPVYQSVSTANLCPADPTCMGSSNNLVSNSNAGQIVQQVASNTAGFPGFLSAVAGGSAAGGFLGAVAAGAVAATSPTALGIGTAVAGTLTSPSGQQIVVNIGGMFEGPGNAIILQTGQVGGSTATALQNAGAIASATGQQVVIGMGNAIPFASGSVNQVIMNNVPIGIGSGYFGPFINPFEVQRILAPGGTVTGTSVGEFVNFFARHHP